MKKLTNLICFVLISILLVSCAPKGHIKVDQTVLFNHLKPYIGVSSVDTLEAVMVDIYVHYRDTAVEFEPTFSRSMKLNLKPTLSNPTLRLTDKGLIGRIDYYRDSRMAGKVSTTDHYNITYNFFTGDIHSNIDATQKSRLSYTKFYMEPTAQFGYINKIKLYYDFITESKLE